MAKASERDLDNSRAANVAELKSRLKNGNISGSYLFFGEEDYLKQYYVNDMMRFCGDRKLNVRTFYSDDFSLSDFTNACRTTASGEASMFDEPSETAEKTETCRLIRLCGVPFDELLKNGDLTGADEKYLLSLIEDPDEGVIIVFVLYPGSEDLLKTGFYKKIAERSLCVLFRHEANGSNMLLSWILRHFSRAGITADRHVISYFNNYVGNDMTTLKNEIDNCIRYLQYEGRDALTVADVDFICKKSLSAQIFDISAKALEGDYAASLAAYHKIRADGEKDLLIYGVLAKAVYDLCTVERLSAAGLPFAEIVKTSKIHEYAVKKQLNILAKRKRNADSSYAAYAAETLLAYDAPIKTGRSDGYDLLEELIFKLAVGKRA